MRAEQGKWQGRLGALMLLVVSGGIAYWLGNEENLASAFRGALMIPEDCLSFGEVWDTAHFSLDLPISNRGKRDIQIKEFVTSCHCIVIEPKTVIIPSHQTAIAHITLDLSPTTTDESEALVRNFEARFVPQIVGGLSAQKVWTIRGRVRNCITCSPQLISFDEDGLVDGIPFPTKKVLVTGRRKLTSLQCDCEPYLHTTASKANSSENQYIVTVTPKRDAPHTFVSAITLYVTSPGSDRAKRVIPVRGRIQDDVELVPGFVEAGPRPIGSLLEEVVLLRSASGRPITVTGIERTPQTVGVVAIPSPTTSDLAFRVSLMVKENGFQTATIRFGIAGKDQRPATLSLFYYGLESNAAAAAKKDTTHK